MTPTIEELKNRYYKIVLEKGDAIYSFWETNRTTSKELVKKANEYAFDTRLKTDEIFRFNVLTFVYALSMRLEKRYSTFWRKLFRWFAFIRERDALQMLKRVLGFHDYTELREMIETEIEKLLIRLSQRRDDDSLGGGKSAGMDDLSMEEMLENFLTECALEDVQKETKLDLRLENVEVVENQKNSTSIKAENSDREKISINETEKSERPADKKKDVSKQSKIEQRNNEKTLKKETDLPENAKEEKPIGKSLANTSIFAEAMMGSQEREKKASLQFHSFSGSPKEEVEQTDDAVNSKEEEEIIALNNLLDDLEKKIPGGGEKENDIFLLFQQQLGDSVKVSEESELLDENQKRMALNASLTKRQIVAIAAKMQEAAKVIMEREEQAWREKMSLTEGRNTPPTQSQPTSPQNNVHIRQGLKK